jgi:hypothetical protein
MTAQGPNPAARLPVGEGQEWRQCNRYLTFAVGGWTRGWRSLG